jgi:hypothetical protein
VPVDVYVGDEQVAILLTGLDSVWALRSRLIIPLEDIVDARVIPRDSAREHLGWRFGGSYWPGTVAAGNFTVRGRHDQREFWSVYRDDEVLQLETRLERPRYIVLQHPDRHTIAWLIGERLRPVEAE